MIGSWEVLTGILVLAIAVGLLSGFWTAFALGVAGVVVVFISGGAESLHVVGNILWNNTAEFVLTAVPLFLLMGRLILISGVGERFFRGMDYWTRWLRGGLVPASIVATGVFSATTGSSVTTAAAVGTVALPEMKDRGYKSGFAAASIAAGGTLGILIPPSIPLIIYGSLVSVSVAKLFAGALIPGVILMILFIAYSVIRTTITPDIAGGRVAGVRWRKRLSALPGMLPVIGLIGLVIGTIYAGVATPTEAAALGALGALAISARRLTRQTVIEALTGTVTTTVMIFAIIVGAQMVSYALVESGASREIAGAIVNLGLGQLGLLVLITAIYIALGDFIDGVSMMLLTLPVLFPVVLAVGFDPFVFGVIMVLFIELGQITPPVGLNLFVIHGIDRTIPHREIIVSALPYAFLMIVMVFLVAMFPDLVLSLAGGAG